MISLNCALKRHTASAQYKWQSKFMPSLKVDETEIWPYNQRTNLFWWNEPVKTDVSWLDTIIKRVSKRLNEMSHPLIEYDLIEILESHLDAAYPILDVLLDSAKTNHEFVTTEQQACLLLLSEILSFIHYAIEQNREWAKEFSVQFQHYIADNAFLPEVAGNILQNILDILHQNELPLIDAIREANARLIECTQDSDSVIEPENITELLEEIAKVGASCEYEMYENLVSQTYQIIPVEVQIVMINEMVHASLEVIRNAAVLMLMHPEPMIRQRTAQIYIQNPKSISSTSLRRLIVMRNWLPEKERVHIDKIIRYTRKANIECEPWPSATITKVIATGFDGVGAQSILVLSRQEKRYHLCGLLLKENIGIREPLMFRTKRKVDSEKIIREMSAEAASIPVSVDYLHQAMSHFLSINVNRGIPPSPLLLNFAELLGVSNWRAQSIDQDATIKKLMNEINKKKITQEAIDKILDKSKSWLDKKDFAESWFEQDAEVDDVLESILSHSSPSEPIDIDEIVDDVCERILEPRRTKWYNRLVWMTLWAKANIKKNGPNWKEFLILANALHQKGAIKQIPLMQAISKETVLAAFKHIDAEFQ